jgi:hypothetical protein
MHRPSLHAGHLRPSGSLETDVLACAMVRLQTANRLSIEALLQEFSPEVLGRHVDAARDLVNATFAGFIPAALPQLDPGSRIQAARHIAFMATDEADLFYRLRHEGGFGLAEIADLWPGLSPGNRPSIVHQLQQVA